MTPVVGGRGRGAEQCEHVVRAVCVARPDLAPVDLPAPGHRLGPALRGVEIGARVRLAHPDAEIALAGHDPRQYRVAHLVPTVAHEHRSALPVRDPVRPHRRACRQQLLGDHVAFEEAALASAVAPGPGHADESFLAAATAELRRVAIEPGTDARREGSRVELLREECTNARPKGLGRLRQRRVFEVNALGHDTLIGPRRRSGRTTRDCHESGVPIQARSPEYNEAGQNLRVVRFTPPALGHRTLAERIFDIRNATVPSAAKDSRAGQGVGACRIHESRRQGKSSEFRSSTSAKADYSFGTARR